MTQVARSQHSYRGRRRLTADLATVVASLIFAAEALDEVADRILVEESPLWMAATDASHDVHRALVALERLAANDQERTELTALPPDSGAQHSCSD